MEPRFGQDFSHVRIHTDAKAAESAQEVAARAYTVGSHVVMGRGEYSPDSVSGRFLLAHELAHVQQASGSTTTPTRISSPGDALERDADLRAASALQLGAAGATNQVGQGVLARLAHWQHRIIDYAAFRAAGFKKDEIEQIYAGNAASDFAQAGSLAGFMQYPASTRCECIYDAALANCANGDCDPTSYRLHEQQRDECDRLLPGELAGFQREPVDDRQTSSYCQASADLAKKRCNDEEHFDNYQYEETGKRNGVGSYSGIDGNARDPLSFIEKQLALYVESRAESPRGTPWYLGRALHAMEDFFAHSNFVRLFIYCSDDCDKNLRTGSYGSGADSIVSGMENFEGLFLALKNEQLAEVAGCVGDIARDSTDRLSHSRCALDAPHGGESEAMFATARALAAGFIYEEIARPLREATDLNAWKQNVILKFRALAYPADGGSPRECSAKLDERGRNMRPPWKQYFEIAEGSLSAPASPLKRELDVAGRTIDATTSVKPIATTLLRLLIAGGAIGLAYLGITGTLVTFLLWLVAVVGIATVCAAIRRMIRGA
jgi:hypothetical protein